MDELFTLHSDSVFLRREALAFGYRDRDLRDALRAGVLAKVRHGAYVPTTIWDDADSFQRHRLQAHAVLRSHSVPLALSHTSAAIEHGLRLYEPDLSKVHVVCLDKPLARSTPDITYHCLPVRRIELETRPDDVSVVGATRAALETASISNVPSGLVVLDSLVDIKKLPLEALHAAFEVYSGPGSRKLQITVRLTREGAESVGETLGRDLCWRQHLPEPRLQLRVYNPNGVLVARTDYAWPEYGVFGEFDGAVKYLTPARPGESAADVVIREKKREDLIRELTGWVAIRLVWADLYRPAETAARIRKQLQLGQQVRSA